MFNRSQEAARRRRQMEAGNARVDAVRGHHASGTTASMYRDDRPGEVPTPDQGGTFFYCTHFTKTGKIGRGGVTLTPCPKRFRNTAKYRRHYRRDHAA